MFKIEVLNVYIFLFNHYIVLKNYLMKLISTVFFILFSSFFLSCKNLTDDAKKVETIVTDSVVSNRPLFHYGPQKNWINDPNGLVFYNGVYHLYYQYNPFADIWGHMSWGHATSKDLMHWTEQPVAIPEFTEHDTVVTSIFSGTAFIDSFNTSGLGTKQNPAPMIAIYTGNVTASEKQLAQYQNMAYSNDNGQTFTEYKANPILDIHSKEFRDPKVFWYVPSKQWVMIVSKPDQYKVLFFGSGNLKDWKKLGEFGGNIGNRATVWECPDIFEMPVANGNGEKKWVITVSAGHPQIGFVSMQYFVGNFNGKTFTADPLPYPLYMDYGKDFYAGITYNDIPASDGRKIMIGWINCWQYARDIPSDGFRGRMSVPRNLTLMKSNGGYELLQQPVNEFDALRKETFSLDNKEVDSVFDLSFHGTSYELDATIDASAAKASGIRILKSKNEETVLKYDNTTKIFSVDRTHSGDVNFSPKFSSVDTAVVYPENRVITLRILVDKRIVTVFINDGKKVITDQVFPLEQEGAIQLFSEGGKTIFKNVRVYKIAE